MEVYKDLSEDICLRNTEPNEILYRFSDFFPNDSNDKGLHEILIFIENEFNSRSSDLFAYGAPFILPPENVLIDILTKIQDFFNSDESISIKSFHESFYYFLVQAFVTNKNDLVQEIVLDIIFQISIIEFNEILIPIFSNLNQILMSPRSSTQKLFVGICNNYIEQPKVFNILKENCIQNQIFKIINFSSDIDLIGYSFQFLTNFVRQLWENNGYNYFSDEIVNILANTLIFLNTLYREELYPIIFELLDILFRNSNLPLLNIAKEKLNLRNVFVFLLENKNHEIFLASVMFLNKYWPDSDLFDNNNLYVRFQNIFKEKNAQNISQNFLFFNGIPKEPILIHEKIQLIGIEVLDNLIEGHIGQLSKYSIIECLLNNAGNFSYQLKESILLFFLKYITFLPVLLRRELMSNYSSGSNSVAENAINLIISSIDSQNVLLTSVTLIEMIEKDPEFWVDLITETGINTLLENSIESTNDSIINMSINNLLKCYNSKLSKDV